MVEHQIVSLACVDSSSTFRPIKTSAGHPERGASGVIQMQ